MTAKQLVANVRARHQEEQEMRAGGWAGESSFSRFSNDYNYNYNMSCNAMNAIRRGEMILEEVCTKENLKTIGCELDTKFVKFLLTNEFLGLASSWHHVGSSYREVDFYTNEKLQNFFAEATEEEINDLRAEFEIELLIEECRKRTRKNIKEAKKTLEFKRANENEIIKENEYANKRIVVEYIYTFYDDRRAEVVEMEFSMTNTQYVWKNGKIVKES